MKKSIYLGIIALATLSLASCSKDEVIERVPQQSAIEFGTYLGRDAQSRAAELSNANLFNFGVFASYTGEDTWNGTKMNFMFDQKVSRTAIGGAWTYSPKKYWPTNQGDMISFWAYAPYQTDDKNNTTGITVVSTNTATTTPQIKYTIVGDNLLKQADFTADVQMNEVRTASVDPDGSDRTVDFNLKHELTRVTISAQLDRNAFADGTKINIKSVKFNGYNFATQAVYTFGNETDERGTWDIANATKNVELDIANLLNTGAPVGLGSGSGCYTTNGIFLENNTDIVPLFKSNEYLFLIPFSAAADSKGVTMTIAYDIVTKDEALYGQHSVTPATKVITLGEGLLQQGKAYNFHLKFYLNEIKLNATVESWGDISNYNDNVDWNDAD